MNLTKLHELVKGTPVQGESLFASMGHAKTILGADSLIACSPANNQEVTA